MQLKSCWHSWESLTAIQFRNNSSFNVPCGLRQRVVVWPQNMEILNSVFSSDWNFSSEFLPEDLIISWRLSLELWKSRGMCKSRCGCKSSLRDCSTFKDALGPNIGQANSAESRWWSRIYFSIVTSLQRFETGKTPGTLNTERHCYGEQAATLLPRKWLFFNIYSFPCC